jgi:hypothetical protein
MLITRMGEFGTQIALKFYLNLEQKQTVIKWE